VVEKRTPGEEYWKGKSDARTALADGKLILQTCGRQSSYSNLYKKLLKERYNIETVLAAGCLITDDISDYIEGYNEIMHQAIKERFGENMLEQTYSEVEKLLS
jgi:hypothetical protein